MILKQKQHKFERIKYDIEFRLVENNKRKLFHFQQKLLEYLIKLHNEKARASREECSN